MNELQDIRQILDRVNDRETLRQAFDLVRRRMSAIESSTAATFRSGDPVQFKDRRGSTVRGTVEKINQKSVSVKTADGLVWRVSPSLLARAA